MTATPTYSLLTLRRRAQRQGWSKYIRTENDERALLAGHWFNQARADLVEAFFRTFLCHSKGAEFAQQPFELLDWQRDDLMFPLFGWCRPDGRRRFTRSYVEIGKKNGKSTIASGIALYMTVGDGEPGAENFVVASTKDEAKAVFTEAANMTEASPELNDLLTVNKSTGNILFPAAKSFLRILPGRAIGNQGQNAHAIIVDELHAWRGRELWDALKWAFAARREPLLFIITTAGDNPLSVCKQQHDYAIRVNAEGKQCIPDLAFFGYVRAADPADDWLDRKTWLKANPSLGVTMDEERFAEDAQEAAKTPESQSAFRRYRLNIWTTGESTWLKADAWGKCERDYRDDDLAGECYGGLDLAKTRDTAALDLLFEQPDGTLRSRSVFWLPEDTAHEMRGIVPYLLWKEQGYIRLTPGNVCDYEFIERDILEIHEKTPIKALAFDPWNAEQLTQRLEAKGITRHAFPQNIGHYASPTSELERLILSQRIHHNGHPIQSWQFGHVQVRANANGDKRPIKPKPDDYRKIDSVAAKIMALRMWQQGSAAEPQGNAYTDDNPGVVLL